MTMTTYDKKKTKRRIDRITRMVDVRRILHDLNVDFTEKKHGDFWFKCPIPSHKDKDASAHICAILGDEHHGIWNCFGCDTAGDVVELVRQRTNLSFGESLLWAEARVHLGEVVYRLDKPDKKPPSLPKQYESPEDPSEWPEEYLNYLKGRGVPWYQIVQYNLGYCDSGKYRGRIIVPVTLGAKLRTWVGRTIYKKAQRITSCDNGLPGLFGSQLAKPLHGPAIITEGWTDALKVDRCGYSNVMAIQTNKLHKDQMRFLEKYEYIIVMPDGDGGGNRLVNAMSEYLHKQEFYIARVPEGLDPDKATDEQVIHSINTMKRWKPVVTENEIEIVY